MCESIGRKGFLMRYPLWILNSLLLILTLVVCGVIFFTQVRIPSRENIEPDEYITPIQEDASKINTKKIYEGDLFDTYQKEFPIAKPESAVQPIPQPPMPQKVVIPQMPKPKFLDPLDIGLKGIIAFVHNESKNRAIIADNKTKKEKTYQVGDKIDDARLIRIFNNKIIVLRSNGQQEVLYLREQDAKMDPAYSIIDGWDIVAHQTASNSYTINSDEFIKRIKSLGQLIDMLDLSTAYKDGKSIGCRIGKIAPNSLAVQLGLQAGDIITSINDIATITTNDRFEIYKQVTTHAEQEPITVMFRRGQQEVTLHYTLEKQQPPEKKGTLPTTAQDDQLKRLQEKYKFAPTVQEIRKQEKRNMMQQGRLQEKPTKTG